MAEKRDARPVVRLSGGMRELRVSLIARTVRQSLRNYGHKCAESVLPECIAADVEGILAADEQAWSEPARDCGVTGGPLIESRDCIGSAYTRRAATQEGPDTPTTTEGLQYRPFDHDDWGVIRNADGSMHATVSRQEAFDGEFDQHRVEGTDPFSDIARKIIFFDELEVENHRLRVAKQDVDIDEMAYRFWSVHPKDLDDWAKTAPPMPDKYNGGVRAWFFACKIRSALNPNVVAPCASSTNTSGTPNGEQQHG